MQSKLFSLAKSDYIKGFITAVAGAVITYLYGVVQNGSLFSVDWTALGQAAVLAGLSYLLKNFVTDSNGKVLGAIG